MGGTLRSRNKNRSNVACGLVTPGGRGSTTIGGNPGPAQVAKLSQTDLKITFQRRSAVSQSHECPRSPECKYPDFCCAPIWGSSARHAFLNDVPLESALFRNFSSSATTRASIADLASSAIHSSNACLSAKKQHHRLLLSASRRHICDYRRSAPVPNCPAPPTNKIMKLHVVSRWSDAHI